MSEPLHHLHHAAPPAELSPAALQRREEMLGELLHDLHRVHRGRRLRRRAIAVAAPAILIGAALGLAVMQSRTTETRIAAQDQDPPPRLPVVQDGRVELAGAESRPASIVNIQTVRTSSETLERYRADRPPSATRLDDESLLRTLASLDRDAGIVRAEGRVWLTRPVTDPL